MTLRTGAYMVISTGNTLHCISGRGLALVPVSRVLLAQRLTGHTIYVKKQPYPISFLPLGLQYTQQDVDLNVLSCRDNLPGHTPRRPLVTRRPGAPGDQDK